MIHVDTARHAFQISVDCGRRGCFGALLVHLDKSLVDHFGKAQLTGPSHAGKIRGAIEGRRHTSAANSLASSRV